MARAIPYHKKLAGQPVFGMKGFNDDA